MSLALPHTLGGRYRLTARIGEGSFAETYLATDSSLGRQVAVKVLREHYARDPRFVARFEQEARAAAAVSNTNVVDIFDYGREGDTLFITMEWVDGTDLKQYLRERGPLPIAESVRLIREILRGLGAIHRAGIVHRDVKPQNVLISKDGEAKLSDFGIARGSADTGLTDTGMAVGTAAYMAPEQAIGGKVTPAADIYSAGVILFEMITGHLPFPGDNPVQVMYRHVNDVAPRPRELNAEIPQALEMVVLRAMAKDPEDRFQSAQEMEAAFDRAPSSDEATQIIAAISPREIPRAAAAGGGGAVPPRRRIIADNSNPAWPWILGAALLLILGLGSIAILAYRGGGNGTPTPTVLPTQIAAVATPSPQPTATPTVRPTATPTVKPTATPTPSPTPTPTPQPTATPTPSPTPTPTPSPTPEPTATPTPKPTPTSAAGTPQAGVLLPISEFSTLIAGMKADNLDGTDFAGAYNAGVQSEIQGAPAGTAAFFSQATPYSAGTAPVEITSTAAIPQVVIAIKGLDDPRNAKAPMEIALNGTVIWKGSSPFPNSDWGIYGILLDDISVLKSSGNQLTIINSALQGGVAQQPWFLVQAVSVYYR
ncbi:MAG TPA: protein kinase [Nitrolancea sp.]|nr:protein kinase [Nitrolancea sp.]